MLLITALALLIAGCAQQTFCCSKQTGSSSTKEAITHHFFVSGIGQKTPSIAAKIVAAQKMLFKNGKPSKHS